MDLFTPLDQYCERTGVGFWNEPLNLLSNFGFIISGLIILRILKSSHYKQKPVGSSFLGILMIVIGLGSALFHSFANVWSMWADIIPISIFVVSYLFLFLRYTAGASLPKTIVLLCSFGALSALIAVISDHQMANGGEAYFGVWVALFGISCFYAGRRQPLNQWRISFAAVAFSISLFMRTVDLKYCEAWPTGTHVFWHLLNSFVIFMLTSAYISERARS